MEDREIVELFWQRSPRAIDECRRKYGRLCGWIARNILDDRRDAEECVSDLWLRAWNAIPPRRPEDLGLWLGRVARNCALDLWKKNRRQKRGGPELLLSELTDCLPGGASAEQELEGRELARLINRWLAGLEPEERKLFLGRYWYGLGPRELAARQGLRPAEVSSRLYRLRCRLRQELEREEVFL